MQYLSQNHLLGKERPLKFVVDAGTGTTAVGLGLGALCLGCVPLDQDSLEFMFYFLLVEEINNLTDCITFSWECFFIEVHYCWLVTAHAGSCQAPLGGNCCDAG